MANLTAAANPELVLEMEAMERKIGRASCRERV